MSVLVRIHDGPHAARLEHFKRVVATAIVPFDTDFHAGHELTGEVLSGRVGAIRVTRVSAPPMNATRTAGLIRAADSELFKIDLQLRGRTVFAQGGREATLRPGDFTLLNLSRPSGLVDRDEHEMVAVLFSPAALPLAPDELDRLTAVRISGRSGPGALTAALAYRLTRRLGDGEPAAALDTGLLDVLAVALAQRLDGVAALPRATRRRALLAGVQAFIEQRLADPALSPGLIAAANHISVRLLHKLFETHETTVAAWVRQRRLERCRRDLLDPSLGGWPAAAIGARWGLRNAANFSRLFRAAYGLPPGRYRLLAAGRPQHCQSAHACLTAIG